MAEEVTKPENQVAKLNLTADFFFLITKFLYQLFCEDHSDAA